MPQLLRHQPRKGGGVDAKMDRIIVNCSVTRTSTLFNRPLVRGDAPWRHTCKKNMTWLQAPTGARHQNIQTECTSVTK
jgi:hypothetical protein